MNEARRLPLISKDRGMEESTVIEMRRGRGRPPGSSSSGDSSAPASRVPWNGGLDKATLERPGGVLLAALFACANQRGQHLQEMAQELGVTYGYISQLVNGRRNVSQISDAFAHACALYLMRPRLAVLIMAGRVSPKDLYEAEEALVAQIPHAMEYVCADPDWGPLVTPQIRALDPMGLYTVVRLYEAATKRQLLPPMLDVRGVMDAVSSFAAKQQGRRTDLEALRANPDGGFE
jgi:transcriptional regulator with XRE-family HTH domain